MDRLITDVCDIDESGKMGRKVPKLVLLFCEPSVILK